MSALKVTLAECPIGLFISSGGELCLKTEYGSNEGRIDAYIVSSGEFFCGDQPQTIKSQREQMVTPVDYEAELATAHTRGAEEMRERAAREAEQPRFWSRHEHENRQAIAVAIRAIKPQAPGGEGL